MDVTVGASSAAWLLSLCAKSTRPAQPLVYIMTSSSCYVIHNSTVDEYYNVPTLGRNQSNNPNHTPLKYIEKPTLKCEIQHAVFI